VFVGTTFTGNGAHNTGEGGGIRSSGNLTLLDCNVTNNYGDLTTGGVYFNGSNLTISNCVINNNSASGRFGGVYATGNTVILNSSISGNGAFDYNAGITLVGNACLIGCTVSSNHSALDSGGGLAVWGTGTVSLTNCTISGNSTTYTPGVGIYLRDNVGTVQAVNCTIAQNGIGVQNYGTFYALNTLIANNAATNGDFYGTLNSQGYNLIGNLTNTTIVGTTNGNIYGVSPRLAPQRNNGGPTLTYALMRGSPAINAGTSIGAPLTDQRGIARPCGKEVDIGAFEYDALLFTDISRVNSTNIHLQVEGPPNLTCTIQASSNFLGWANVFAASNGLKGVWEFVDQEAGNHPNRFYRAFIDN
jgi:hypothetical protein